MDLHLTQLDSPLKQRRAGVLLHPTSLPGPLGNGDLGPESYRFVEFLAASGMGVWEILPLGPTHDNDDSPYNCPSASAGNPLLISPDLLLAQGWLTQEDYTDLRTRHDGDTKTLRHTLLHCAQRTFAQRASDTERAELTAFRAAHGYWLDDYALYQALKEENRRASWVEWPATVRDRKATALAAARARLHDAIAQIYFEQFVFFNQWLSLKKYANEHGVLIFGDMPIFVAHDSADVWAHRDYFTLDAHGNASLVTGVPPDYFSPEGQRWGHPHYNWAAMQADGFQYWMGRMQVQLQLCDVLRIDHFRGFESHWEIPASSPGAATGRWVQAPGDQLFAALQARFGALPMVAEDLGMITPEVYALRNRYNLPGMMILQFAFDGSPHNPYLPYKHAFNSVVYTGTHDNDTTLGWFNELPQATKDYVMDYLGAPTEPMPWPLIRACLNSTGLWAILPLQDILMLDNTHRMNIPGTTTGNWQWRFSWDQLPLDIPARLRHFNRLYGRVR